MKTYKGTDAKLSCQGFKFELGKTYKVDGALIPCENGFHSCRRLFTVQRSYYVANSRFFECEIGEEFIEDQDKICSREITLVRELTFAECMAGFNLDETGKEFEVGKNTNLGFSNTGNSNIGNFNIGNNNNGSCNTGNSNIGNFNIGNFNTGNNNNGSCNIGNSNTGNFNTGNNNNGSCNTGSYNTGSYNKGNYLSK